MYMVPEPQTIELDLIRPTVSNQRHTGREKKSMFSYKPDWNSGILIQSATDVIIGFPLNYMLDVMYSLCHIIEKGGRLRTSTIRDEMSTIWPKGKDFTKHDAFNI
ncbi:hypothetical protein ACHAWF_011955 [Thalassiosira exigua]